MVSHLCNCAPRGTITVVTCLLPLSSIAASTDNTTMQTAVVLPAGGQSAGAVPVQNVVILPQHVAPSPKSVIMPNYSSRSSLLLGSTQIAIGILCILLNAVAIHTYSPESIIGHGTWGGIFVSTLKLDLSGYHLDYQLKGHCIEFGVV